MRLAAAEIDRQWLFSQPSFAPEIDQHTHGNRHHKQPYQRVTVIPIKFRHCPGTGAVAAEVHAINAGHKGERNKGGSDYGEHAHNLVHPVADARQVDVEHART